MSKTFTALTNVANGTISKNAFTCDHIPTSVLKFWMVALTASLGMTFVQAAPHSTSPGAKSRYQQERAVCMSGQSNQDRATCLKEAGAARAEATRGRLDDGQSSYQKNAMNRCNALPADDRDACQRRIGGEGMTTGSVENGGVMRELVTPEPVKPPAKSGSVGSDGNGMRGGMAK